MNDNTYSFLYFLIKKDYLKKINFPLPGCMVVKFDGDKIVDCSILKELQSFTPADQYQFFDSLTADSIKKHFVEYVTTEKIVTPFKFKPY